MGIIGFLLRMFILSDIIGGHRADCGLEDALFYGDCYDDFEDYDEAYDCEDFDDYDC